MGCQKIYHMKKDIYQQSVRMEALVQVVALIAFVSGQDTHVLQLDSGPVEGTKVTIPEVQGETFAFYGIPYAAPPIGDLRFAPPKKPAAWTKTLDATKFAPICPQETVLTAMGLGMVMDLDLTKYRTMEQSESCLTLDVYAPADTGSRTVMVFIHGGAFRAGGSRVYDGSFLPILKDIVAVHIQYRLGLLGWIATGDGTVKGNMGFLDQVLALEWVRDNIAKFGGNPNDVTIYGESAGAMSVSLHLASTKSSGLFHRAILHSGGLFGMGYFSPPMDIVGSTKAVAKLIGCDNATDIDMVVCLRSLSDVEVFWKFLPSGKPLPFIPAPHRDVDVLPELKDIVNKDVDLMAGTTEFEGYIMAIGAAPDVFKPNFDVTVFEEKVVKPQVMLQSPRTPDRWPELSKAFTAEYAGNLTGDDLRAAAAELIGDAKITFGTYFTAKLMADQGTGKVFFFELVQRPSMSKRPPYISADHGDDLAFFGPPTTGNFLGVKYGGQFTPSDKRMAEIMINYWTNFAKTGDPNTPKVDGLKSWPLFKEEDSYLILNETLAAATFFKAKRMKFWMDNFHDTPDSASTAKLTANTYMSIILLTYILHTFYT